MTKDEEFVTIELNDLTDAELEMVNVVIHEGELRERERIIALLNSERERMVKDSPHGEAYYYAEGLNAAVEMINGTYEKYDQSEGDE